MEELMRFVPKEVAFHILQYTYRFQDKPLLNDIVNYTKSRARLEFIYITYFTMRDQLNDYKCWLSNDIGYYMNNFFHTDAFYGGGYLEKFYTRFSRNPFLNTRQKIHKYIAKIGSNGIFGINKEINIYLGLLTIEERQDLINWVIYSYTNLSYTNLSQGQDEFLALINSTNV